MASDFTMRIYHKPSGEFVEWAPGQLVESNFVTELVNRIKAKNIGLLKSEADVLAKVEQAVRELFFDLKKQV